MGELVPAAVLQSARDVARSAAMREALLSRGVLPERAAELARAVVAQPNIFFRWTLLLRGTELGPLDCRAALVEAGLWASTEQSVR